MRPNWLIGQLPIGMLEDDFLLRFLGIFQEVADSVLGQVETLEHLVDPTVAPLPMVRYLASWLGEGAIDESLPDAFQREYVRTVSANLAWRGTGRAVRSLLELVTGAEVFVEDTGGVFREGEAPREPGHVVIGVHTTGWTTEDHLVRMVRAELPATVTFELWVGQRRAWPEPQELSSAALDAFSTVEED
ncbi:MAG: phage tail protein [Acidimicrobiia bacterium]|nr:phage tail protein [Acidimicrobiia bacterium]